MSSGIGVSHDIIKEYNDFKMKSAAENPVCMVFKLSDDLKEILMDSELNALVPKVDKKSDDEQLNRTHLDFLKEQLVDAEPRFIVFDFRFTRPDGTPTDKIGYMFWCSDNAPVKKRMTYASTNTVLKKKLECGAEFQVNDKADMDYNDFKSDLNKNK